ncbi:hypothetical protein Vretimale_17552, partial [Volvox reticuliferus]
ALLLNFVPSRLTMISWPFQGGGYEVMLPRHGADRNPIRVAATATDTAAATDGGGSGGGGGPRNDRSFLSVEAEEFRLTGWLDPASGEWCMERHCINVPYALMYKGYSDAYGCWGTYTVQQEPGAAAAAAGLPGAHATAAMTSPTTATTASTIGPAGSSSIRRLRLFRLFRDPSLEPPKDLLKLLAAMQVRVRVNVMTLEAESGRVYVHVPHTVVI